jgi:two-component system phosphate regulon sensor histidine kinase PhoR
MSRRIIASFLVGTVIAMFFLTSSFLLIFSVEKINLVKEELKTNNELLINYMKMDTIDHTSLLSSVSESIRITLIDQNGDVIFDSMGQSGLENHLGRLEVQEALTNGEGSDIRVSGTLDTQMVYYATRLSDGKVLRSSTEAGSLNLGGSFIKYMLITFALVVGLSYLMSRKIADYLLEPILEMTVATERIANGEYTRRIRVRSDAELGKLGMNFNNMAERLETTFIENEEKQHRLEAILKSMNSGVFAFDNNDNIIMINPFCRQLFGISENVIGKSVYDIKELRELIFMLSDEDDITEVQIEEPIRKDIRIKSATIRGERGALVGTVVVLEDITDLKKLEKMRSQFVANVSHELKTPLTSIKGFSETLKYVQDDQTKNKFLDIINDESERLTRLINDILTLSSIEQVKSVKNEEMDISYESEKVYHLLHPKAEAKNVVLSISQKEPLYMWGDIDLFNQLLLNLVDNAIKYTKENGEVHIDIGREDSLIKLVVSDTGVGIPEKHLDRIFERFYRVDRARDRAMGGTGLGLAIVKHIVLSMGGTIEVASEIGKGTQFTVYLPIDKETYNEEYQ